MGHAILLRPLHRGMIRVSRQTISHTPFLTFASTAGSPKDNGSHHNIRKGTCFLRLTKTFLTPSCSPDQNELPTQADHQAEFYKDYHKVAKEYDKEFLKNRKEDLDTLLIFVSPAANVDQCMLIGAAGWSIFCPRHRVHHPGRYSKPARPG